MFYGTSLTLISDVNLTLIIKFSLRRCLNNAVHIVNFAIFFPKFYQWYSYDLISKFHVKLKSLLRHGFHNLSFMVTKCINLTKLLAQIFRAVY